MAEQSVTLSSQEGTKFEVPLKVANMSKLVETMTEDGEVDEEVPLMDVKAAVLEKVIQFCTHHADPSNPFSDIEKPLKTANLAEVVTEWDVNFVNVEKDMLFELILAANYLDIKPLLDLTCAKVATTLKGKTPEEIRIEYNIRNDFTPEEEAQVREENRWCAEA